MKRLALEILFFSFFSLASPSWATSYFLATAAGGGNDSNNGKSLNTPWLTPNHAVNCGDVITAAASNAYASSNFNQGAWGPVTCAAGNSVAWLTCATFDGCKISAVGYAGMWVSSSYWGVQGWEVTTKSSPDGACFYASPATNGGPGLHHVIFANDIANGCYGSAFLTDVQGSFGVDYLAIVGNIAYNGAQGTSVCWSGITIGPVVASDSLPGTHIYVAGNFAWDNLEPSTCNGGVPTDGEGIDLDSLSSSYPYQIAVENNISFLNGQAGIRVGITTSPTVYVANNTTYGNNGDASLASSDCAEIAIQGSDYVQVYSNLVTTKSAKACGGGAQTNYGFGVWTPCVGDAVYNNYGYSPGGSNDNGSAGCGGFTFGLNNTFGADPSFANVPATNPGAPSCGNASSVPNCMKALIADLTPTTATAIPYGYQIPSSSQTYDPLFPQWLCNVNLPAGLVTMGCLAQSSLPAPPTITGVQVK